MKHFNLFATRVRRASTRSTGSASERSPLRRLGVALLACTVLVVPMSAMAQTTLAEGEMAIIGMDTVAEDFSFVAFVAMDAGTEIYFTDEEASGSYTIGTGEGTVLFTAPAGGIAAGTVITYQGNSSYFTTTSDGAMALGNSGDGIIAYQGSSVGSVTTFLHGVGEDSGDMGSFPGGFSNYVLFGNDDGEYNGTRTGDAATLMAAINNSANWTTSGSGVTPFTTTSFSISGGSTAPEIAVLGTNLTEIADGDDTPASADGTDFGLVAAGLAVTNTFTITNSGTATLTNTTPISLTGDGVFTVDANPGGTVAAGAVTTFKIKFAPTSPGAAYTGLVSIANNDSDENPYTFSIEGTAPCFTAISGLHVSATNATDFTVSWSAVSGADGYVLDVSTSATFSASSGGGGGIQLGETFDSGLASSYTTGDQTLTSGVWGCVSVYQENQYPRSGYAARINDDTGGACLVTPELDTAGAVTFWYRAYSDTGTFKLQKSTDKSSWTDVDSLYYDNTTYAQYSNDVNDASGTLYLRILNDNQSAHLCVDDFEVTSYGSSTPDYVAGYSNKAVSGTSHSVTGLTAGVTYYYRLTATNVNCTAVSTTSSVTTVVAVPSITVDDNGTQVTAANVVTGTVNHVLSQFSVAVATVAATLNEVDFTTAGTYDADDLVNLKLRYSTDATLDAGDATLDTITGPAAAGAKSFTGLSQAISAGNTGYFFITADIDGSADYGHTVSVNAIANADLSFVSGTKSGSASAGGAQTFVASAPTSNGSVDSFTAVGTDTITVSWTSGNGERRIVVVRSGAATSWTPSDGTAPSGVNANFGSATDQGSGNKICYDGTGTSVTLAGLSASTTYYVTIFEYNGTGTYVKYYTAGTEATGNQTTSASAIWINPTSAGTPMATYYLGDTMGSWNVQFEIGQTSWNDARVGIGTALDGSSYNWGTANWYEDGTPPNKRVQRDLSGYQFTSAGSHYVICQAKANVGDTYTSKSGVGWGNPQVYPPADLSSAYFTCSALMAPGSLSAAKDATHPATRVDLGWAQWNGKNVLITYSTAAPSGSPVQGTSYSAGNTFGNQTVISGSQGGTSLEVTGLTPGETYYFNFYSENFSYYSAVATAAAVTLDMPQARNTSGGAPEAPAAIYLGDSAQVFGLDSWGQIESQWGQGRLWIRQGNTDLTGGTAGSWSGYVNSDHKAVTSGIFNATGTWYWGIQMDYGSYGTDFWYVDSEATWAEMASAGTAASLSVTVSAINDPGSQSATVDAVNYTSEIDLSWAQNAQSHDVMVVRKLSTDSWTEPTQGTAYAATDTIGSGTVIYNGSGTSFSDTGLTEDTTYDYKFYSVNNDYYSPGVTAQEATAVCEPDPPATLWASATNQTDFTAAWSASTHATNYFLDVSTNESFGGSGGGSETNLIISEMCDPGNNYSSDRYIEIFNAGGASVDLTGWSVVAVGNGSDIFTWTLSGTIGSSNALTCGDSGNTQFTPDFTGGSWSGANSSWNGKDGDGAYLVKSGTTIDDASSHGNFENKTTVRDATVGTGVTVFASGEWTSTGVTDAGSGASTPGTHDCSSVPSGSGGSSTPSYVPGYSNRLVGAGTSASVTGLTTETTYYFRLRAQGTGGCTGTTSTTANVTTLGGAPAAPAGLSASDGTSATQVDVSWTDVGNETGYVIWRHTSDVFGSATAIYTNAANDTTYSDTDVSALAVYYYWVTATNAVGSSSASNSDTGYAAGTAFRFNGFEGTSSDNWSWEPTAGTAEIGPRDTDVTGKTGDYSVLLRGSTAGTADPYIVFDNVRLPANCQHISLEVGYAALGVDANDDLYLDVSYDNGSTWGVSTQLVDGFSGLDVDFGETVTDRTAGANPYVLTLADNATNVRVRIRYDEADGNDNQYDRYFIDDVKLVTACDAPTVSWDAVRTVTNEDYTTQFSIPVSISQAADATVRVAIAGTAQAGGTDFTAASTTLVFTAGGSTTANLQVTNVDDSDAEGPEMVRFTLTQAEGCRVAGPDVHTLFIRDDDGFSLATANLSSGTNKIDNATTWDESGQRLLSALLPDVVAMQEWVITNVSYRAFVDANFGAEYDYYVEPESDSQAMPNGVISRWPIVASNEWTDNYVGSRDYVHVKIDLPGTKDLNLISVHFNAGDDALDITARANEAAELTNYIAAANFGTSNYLAIAGDLNQSNRTSETVLTTLGTIVTDATQPTDRAGSKNTNPSDARPYDFVLPDTALEAQHAGLSYAGTAFNSGQIFDTREWGDHQYPALGSDSEAPNLTHHPVVKVFSLGEVVEPPASFSATTFDETRIDLAFATNAAGDNVVIVYNTTGTFDVPSGSPPAAGNSFAGGTLLYNGTGSSHSHTGLDACETYYYAAWSMSATPVYSTALTDDTATDSPAAPTGLYANPTNQFDFTANWSAVDGAAGYVIDVSTSGDFGGGGTLAAQGFEGGAEDTWGFSTNSGTVAVDTSPVRTGSGSLEFNGAGTVTFDAVDLPGTGASTVTVAFAASGADSGDDLYVSVCTWDGGVLSTNATKLVDGYSNANIPFDGTNASNPTTVSPNPYSIAVSATATQVYIKVYVVGASAGDYYYIDDVSLTGPVTTCVDGYEARPVAGTSVSVTGLTDAVTYYWRVAATGAECTGDYSIVTNVTTVAGPPPKPTGLTASDGTETAHVALSWNNDSAKETGFVIYRHTADVFGSATAITTNAADVTTYNDADAAVGTLYYYWVVATNGLGSSSESDSDSGFRKLATVGGLSASDCSDTAQVGLGWTDIAGETGYGIWRNTSDDSGTATWLANAAADAESYNDTTAVPGTLYYYWVRATNSTCETLSDFQAAGASGVRQLGEVTVDASDGTDTSRVVVQWTDIAGETGYSIWRSGTNSSATAEWLANVAADGNVLSEDFEDSWAEAPSGWSRELVHGTTNWLRDSGGHSGYPAAAHGGTYNALLYSSTKGYTNRLITPSMDLSGFSSAYVDFWHAQAVWSTDQDILRVLYRTSSVASWVQLDEYTGSITSWTERNLSLPNLSGDYYVAFEGVANYGYGVVLDDVAVTGTVSSVTNYYDEEASAGVQYYYWVVGTNAASGCQSEFGAGDGGWRRLVENPSAATFTRDGREMVRAAITANAAANDILVLHSTAAEVSGTPALNSSYAVGDTVGNAKVVYNGAAGDFREHVVEANSTNHYRVFSVLSNAYYSSGIIPTGSPIETKPYQAGVIVETFSYTNVTLSTDSFTNKAGGAFWATGSNWVLETSGTGWQVFTNDTNDGRPTFFTAASNMATLSGNRAFADLNGGSRWANATRQIPTTNSGVMYVSALMAYRYEGSSEGTDRWLTIALMNGGTEELEFGKAWGANRTFTIRRSGANAASSYGLNPYGDSTNNWYWVVLKYDFDNDTAQAAAFYRGENIPSSEPSTWDVEWSSMSIAQVTALRLKAGSGTDWLGGALFDEVRVSSVWPALLGEPDLVITPESEDFGNVEVGRADLQTFWVQNIGGDKVPMTVSSLTLGGANPTNFLLSTNTLGTIEYGQSNSFTVTFLPNVENQAYSATLYVTNSSGVSPVLVSLAGYGIPSQLTNAPAIDAYEVGETNQVTDAMVTSGVFSVVLDVYHPAGLATATYDLLNGDSTVILADQTFESWVSANGEDYVLSNATHTGYWPGTPADDYLVRAVLISSNGYGITNTAYASLGSSVEADDLFISEYIEGSSNNKAVEIYNGTGASVDLSDYTLRLYFNGGTSPSSISLSGTLAAGGVYVVAHSSANATILAAADLATGSLTFNGNDVVALAKSGSNIDVIGTIGSSANFAEDVTKVRKSSVTDGVTTYDTDEWTNYASDTTTYLGDHTMDGAGSGTPMEFAVVDDDTDAPVITNPLVNGATTPAGSASGPTIAIGDVPAGGFDLDWDIQDTGSGVFAASNHYTLARSNAVISSGAVPTGSDGDGQGSALAVGTTIAKSSLIWGDYVLSLAGADYDPEWDGDISSVSNVYYFVIAAPSIGLLPSSLDYGSVERDVTSNLTVAVTNSGNADLVVSGIGFSGTGSGYFSVASPAVPLTVTAGTASNVVVSFTPTAGGTFSVTMTLTNNTPNAAEATVSIAGECYDPETAPPSIYAYAATDAAGITNEATDHALAHGGLTLDFTLWHYMGVDPATASYDLLDPSGALVWTNGTFDTVTETTLNSKTCQVFTAAVPDILPAVTGVYTARVTATSSNAYSVTDQATYDPPAAGSAAPWPLDRFSREDSVNDAGNGWLPASTGETNGNIAVTDRRLQFYGEGGTVGDGRLAVVRDMTGRYQTVLTNNSGTLTWAFNFFSGQNNMTGLGSGKYAGLFVLGSTSTNFVGGSGNGYAVRICSNQVALVRFTGGLNSDADATVIGTPAALSADTPMGVRVDLNPATGEWTLYTTNWGGSSVAAFGDPLAAADMATSTADSTYLGATDLPYVGCYWNHGSGTPGDTYGAAFDDVHAPYVMPAAPLMTFLVYDEDMDEPEHSGFNVDGRQFTLASINPGGLTVTGLVADANGVYAGTSNVWTLFSNSIQVATGSMTMTPDTDGEGTAASPAALSATIGYSDLETTNYTFTFQIVSTDYDTDRPGDFLSVTNAFTFYIVDSEAPTPSNATALADGMEMAVLTWEKGAAQEVVVLWSTNPITANALVPGEAYNQNDDGPEGTKVIYRGTNSYVVSGGVTSGVHTEVVVPEGATHYFRVFGANGTVYSSGYSEPAGSVATLEYEDGEIVDQFAYTNSVMLVNNGPATGQGWDGGWFGDSNAVLRIDDTNLLHGVTMYPDPYANKLQWTPNSQVATNVEVIRKLATQRSGRTFIAFMMNYKVGSNDDVLDNKYVGLSLMSGEDAGTEEIFFGKIHGHDKDAGITVPGTGEYVSDNPNYAFEGLHFRDYMIVGEWDPAIKTIRMWAYYQGDLTPIPQEYTNATPIAVYSNAAFSIADITGIRLAAGMSEADTNSLDHVYFDEVRVGGTWDEVLNFNYPKAFGFSAGVTINGTNYVSDGELSEAGKSYPISYTLYHRTGVTNAQFNIVTNVGSLDGLYTSPLGLVLDPNDTSASDRYRDFTNMVSTRLDTNLVTLGVYTSRVWMTAVSGKATNTLFMEGMAGATDLFFGEFGEGEGYDKYVEIYNGTGGSIDLSQYYLKVQMNPSDYEDYTQNTWSRTSYLATNTFWLDHGETIVIANGGGPSGQKADPALTNALATAGLDYLLSSNDVLNVSGNDVIGLFHVSSSDEWIDACGIAPNAGSGERYIMRRIEDAEVPLSYPLPINTNDWDYRAWATPDSDKDVGYTNFLATAGEYDRNVGLGGYITFTVYDDDTLPPAMGTNNVLMIGTGAPYTPLTASNGSVEVVLTAWNFNGDTPAESATTWSGSLIPNGTITCHPDYTPGPVDDTDSGTSENDMFGVYDQPNDGVAELASIGTYFTQADTAWIQYEIELTSADDMVLSWAEAGGSFGFNTAQLSWSSDGVSFSTNAAWPSWDPTDGSTYVTRYAEFDGVVTPGLSKVYIRINLGPGYGGSSGYYRMDNVQLTGYPQEFQVTDGQIAASGNKLQFQANLYDTNSGLDKAQAVMELQGATGTRVPGNDTGDGTTETDTMWWELSLTGDDITEYVNASLTGNGLSFDVDVPDLDADRPGDPSWLDGRIGQVRVIDDDTGRPRLSLTSMKPLSSILAQWYQMTDTNSLLPTKSDASVDAGPLKTKSGTDAPKSPYFSREPTNGYHYIEAWAWQGQQKCWLIEVTPEADMAVTNLTFTAYMHRTNGVSHYRIDHYVDGVLENNILGDTYWVDPPGMLDPTVWYTRSHGWATNEVVLEAGKVNQIRLYGLGSSNIGARWRLSELTLWQAALSTNGVLEVTDAEFTDGSFKLIGNAWDSVSGIASTNNATESKRPMFSLSAPDGGVYVTNELFTFTAGLADGGATTKEDGAFEGLLPTPVYTNVMLGGYTGEAHAWDYDSDRTSDDLQLRGDLAMYVVDNDIMEPTTVGVVRVNGNVVPETAPDRFTVDWTNQPEFIVSFDSPAVDQDPGAGYSDKQRGLAGIGEYRVATNADINTLSASNRATLGTPYPVAATNGALANYGFELNGEGWTLDANCSYRSLAVFGTNDVKEGTNSLRQVNGGVAHQTIEFRNTAGTAPIVGVSGWYRSDTVGGPTFRIEAFATNDLVTPVAVSNIQPGTAAAWTSFTGEPAALGDETVEVLKVSLIDGGGNTTFWDDIRLSVDVGANTPSMRFSAGTENQGLNPQYLFAVDGDNNRSGDRLAGEASPFYIAYDVTPPTKVGNSTALQASTDSVDDPTTQFDLQWSTTGVGPDDETHANHPTGQAADRDLLSPWQTYKIYYNPFDPLEVPVSDPGPGNANAYIFTNFIATGAYQAWSNKTWASEIADPGAPDYQPNYQTLTNAGRSTIRLYDLDFDQDYAVVIVGVDKAGNEGPADIYSWATNNTIKFALTRGWAMAKDEAATWFPAAGSLANTNATRAAALAWTASGTTNPAAGANIKELFTEVKKEYDLIYWDAASFRESSDNEWNLLGTVQTNWFVDDGGQFRGRGDIRFYRASYKDRWKTTRLDGTNVVSQRPIASEEVYALHNVVLSPGQNFAALHGVPYLSTFEAVFGGLESFPGSETPVSATKVEFFTPGTNAGSTAQYYLNASGRWIELSASGEDVADVTTNVQEQGFFNRGFSITLPDPLPTNYVRTTALDYNRMDTNGAALSVPAMIWSPIAQVPTNSFSQVIQCGSHDGRTETLVYNAVALRLPVSTHPSKMRLLESGFVNGYKGQSDEIYTMNTATKSPLSNSKIYCDPSGVWRLTRTDGLVPGDFFKPNDVIVIISRNWVGDGSWTWSYHPAHLYPGAKLPDRWMGH